MIQLIRKTCLALGGLLLSLSLSAAASPQLQYALTVSSKSVAERPAQSSNITPGSSVRFYARSSKGGSLVILAAYNGNRQARGLDVQTLSVAEGQEGKLEWKWPSDGKATKIFAVCLNGAAPQAATLKSLAENANKSGPAANKLYQRISEYMKAGIGRGGKTPETLGGVLHTSADQPCPTGARPSVGPGAGRPVPVPPYNWRPGAHTLTLEEGNPQVVLYNFGK